MVLACCAAFERLVTDGVEAARAFAEEHHLQVAERLLLGSAVERRRREYLARVAEVLADTSIAPIISKPSGTVS